MFFMFVVVFNILAGWYNLFSADWNYKQGRYSNGNFSFACGLTNIMMALCLIGLLVYRYIVT